MKKSTKPDIKKYRSFFFDFDGVIMDTLDIKTKAFGDLFDAYGPHIRKLAVDYHLNNSGVSRYEKFKYYYKHILHEPINKKIIRDLDKKFSRLVFNKVMAALFVKGALEFIKRLKVAKRDCFVISATPQKEIRRVVKRRRLVKFFEDVVGSPTSKEENLKRTLKRYGVKAGEALYFGDAKSDYNAAKMNKVDFVGIVNKKSRELENVPNIPKMNDFSLLAE